MAITYVGGTSGGSNAATYAVSLNGTLTGGSGSSPIEGDLVIVATGLTSGNAQNVGISSPTDYTQIGADQTRADTRDANMALAYKFMGSTPDTSVTVLGSNSASYGSSTVIHVWRGVDPTTPLDVAAVPTSAASAARPDPAAIQPVTAGAIIIAAGFGTGATSQTVFTIPSGMTNGVTNKQDGTTGDSSIFICSFAWTSGSYNPAAATGGTTSTGDSWVANTIALRPYVEAVNVNVDVTGAEITLANTGVTVAAGANTTVTGEALTLGNTGIDVTGTADVPVTGAEATLTGVDVTVTTGGLDINVDITGAEATLAGGDVTVTGTANIAVTGSQIVPVGGDIVVTAGAVINVSGSALALESGDIVWPDAIFVVEGAEAVITGGEVTVEITNPHFEPIVVGGPLIGAATGRSKGHAVGRSISTSSHGQSRTTAQTVSHTQDFEEDDEEVLSSIFPFLLEVYQ